MTARPRGLAACLLAACLCATVPAAPEPPTPRDALLEPATGMGRAARSWLAALAPERREKAALPFDTGERQNWGYVPRPRRGASIGEMSAGERRAARALLESSLSAGGLTKLDAIVALEEVLFAQSGSAVRDPELYFFTLFGAPGGEGEWGWRFEGHHASLNWTVRDGRLVSSTPQFLGANPAEVPGGPRRGTRALAGEEDLARALVRSLTPAQRRLAILQGAAPPDILTGRARRVEPLPEEGIAWADLASEQQEALLGLLREHAAVQSGPVARARLERIQSGLASVRFAWAGGIERGEGHYYRIQGASFLVEYDNTQDNANHIHCVWREFEGDWGPDLLARHYASAPHHEAARRIAAGRIP